MSFIFKFHAFLNLEDVSENKQCDSEHSIKKSPRSMRYIGSDFAKEIDSIVNSLKLPSSSSPNTFSPIISSSAFL